MYGIVCQFARSSSVKLSSTISLIASKVTARLKGISPCAFGAVSHCGDIVGSKASLRHWRS